MLKAACGVNVFSREDMRHLITYGKDGAVALFVLDDGSEGGVQVFPSSSYFLYRPDQESSFERLSSPSKQFLDKMAIVLDESSGFILSILDPDQELLFVNSKPSTNFTLVKLISSNDELETVIENSKEFDSVLKDFSDTVSNEVVLAEMDLANIKIEDVVGVRSRIESCDYLIPFGKDLSFLKDSLDRIAPAFYMEFGVLLDFVSVVSEVLCDLFVFVDGVEVVGDEDFEETLDLVGFVLDLSEMLDEIGRIVPVLDRDFVEMESLLVVSSDLSEILNDVSLVRIEEIVDFSFLFTVVSFLSEISVFFRVVRKFGHDRDVERKIEEILTGFVKELAQISEVVDCPVRGKVVYLDDENCVSCDI
jgi:hypothetical protein